MKVDVLSYLREYGHDPVLKSNIKIAYINCPECDADTPHLWIKLTTGGWGCWKNERHRGGFLKLVQFLEKCSYGAAKNRAAEFSRISHVREEDLDALLSGEGDENDENGVGKPLEIGDLPEIALPEGNIKATSSNFAMSFLRTRGLRARDASKWRLGYCHNGVYRYRRDRTIKVMHLRRRIIIPVYIGRRLVAFQARDVTYRAQVSYLSSPVEENDGSAVINRLVFNADDVNRDFIVVTEGALDAMSVGKEHGIALFGKRLYPEQLGIIVEYVKPQRAVVAMDADVFRNEDIAMELATCIPRVDVLNLPPGEDPSSLGKTRFWRFLKAELGL